MELHKIYWTPTEFHIDGILHHGGRTILLCHSIPTNIPLLCKVQPDGRQEFYTIEFKAD